ncbi:MAG: hypothetical protein PUG71_01895 [bacterium]|nr:hypothetical protein [bacterium]
MRKASIIRVKQVGIRVVSVCYYIMLYYGNCSEPNMIVPESE